LRAIIINASAMPAEDGVRAEDRADLSQNSTTKQLLLRRQPSASVIGQEQALFAEMFPEDAILLPEVANDGLLVSVDPSGRSHD
jgi:hypothetical protein